MKNLSAQIGILTAALFLWESLAVTSAAQSDFSAAIALEEALVETISRNEKSVVSIARIRLNPNPQPPQQFNPFPFPDQRDQLRQNREDPRSPEFIPNEFGAGVILALQNEPEKRYILTNYHVVKGGPVFGRGNEQTESLLYVSFAGGTGYYSSILAADPRSDLAVLAIDYEKLQLKPEDLKPLQFAQHETLRKGQIVIGLGNPYAIARDGSPSASWGIVSNLARAPKPPPDPETFTVSPDETLHHTGTLIQVDMRLNLGTSGGALLNLHGDFVGLTTSLAALEGYETSAGFAIPADKRFQRIFETLARGEEVEYGFLGVTPQDIPSAELTLRKLPLGQSGGAELAQVFHNSPAGQGGIKRGDIVLSIDGRTILNRRDLMREISLLGPETRTTLKVFRPEQGRALFLNVKLGKWPSQDEEEMIVTHPRYPDWRGLQIDYPTGRSRFLTRSFSYPDAVLVRAIEADSPSSATELQSGEFIATVNDRPVRTPAEFHKAVEKLSGTVVLKLIDGREIAVSDASNDSP
ncbi:MAG TPA: trypsin-like peptidase domain-containing protein [Planctomycetaceae bacterium]|nr:trypsin-like peptidase domain-containing protein [Planctomycetaceae bacterium]